MCGDIKSPSSPSYMCTKRVHDLDILGVHPRKMRPEVAEAKGLMVASVDVHVVGEGNLVGKWDWKWKTIWENWIDKEGNMMGVKHERLAYFEP